MAKLTIEGNNLIYTSFFKKNQYMIEEIQWAYAQFEAVNMRVCCGKGYTEIYRLILRTQNEKVALELDTKGKLEDILVALKKANPDIVIGYNKNWEAAFQRNYQEFIQLSSR